MFHEPRVEVLTSGETHGHPAPVAGLGFAGCSSHSGRHTFITRAACKASEAGGSLRDVQQLASHASLNMTQRYIEGDSDAKRKLVNLI